MRVDSNIPSVMDIRAAAPGIINLYCIWNFLIYFSLLHIAGRAPKKNWMCYKLHDSVTLLCSDPVSCWISCKQSLILTFRHNLLNSVHSGHIKVIIDKKKCAGLD